MSHLVAGPKVGERIRIAMQYGGNWRPLIWLRIGRDGSIYLGLLLGQPTTGTKGMVTGARVVDVKYKDGKPVTGEDLRKGSRVSFKASGEIHLGSEIMKGEPLEKLSSDLQLCLALFVHPSKYRPPVHHSSRDYDFGIVDYPVDDARPLYASIHVAPWGGGPVTSPPGLPRMVEWQSFAFGFEGLSRTPNYALGVVIGHGVQGTWPLQPSVAVVAKRDSSGCHAA